MIKTVLASSLATLFLAGTAIAAGPSTPTGLRIESEAQFASDYGSIAEHVAPGVYQIVHGSLAGKTVTMGEAGLAYDLAAVRAETPRTLRERLQRKSRIRQLEAVQARYRTQTVTRSADMTKRSLYTVFNCTYWPINGKPINYTGTVSLYATTEYYLSDGGGGLNPYYARARAGGSANVSSAWVPVGSGTITVTAVARNGLTGQVVQRAGLAAPFTAINTGDVGSGPSFGHDLTARATATGNRDCFGYASISDALQ